MRSDLFVSILLTLTLHVGILLPVAMLLDRVLRARLAWRELAWRVALFGGALTAGVQMVTVLPRPLQFVMPAVVAPGASLQSSSQPMSSVTAPAAVATDRANRTGSVASDAGSTRTAAEPVAPAAVPSHARVEALMSFPWQGLLLAAWLAGASLALFRLAFAWSRLRRRLALARPLDRSAIGVDADALALQAHIGSPRLAELDDLASPMAAPGGRIVMPRWALDLLDREQLRAMLAHETAHLARRDPAWKLATALWCALLWFLPLGAVRRRLDELAELACDAWAARHLGDGRALAECLAECAGQRGGFDPGLVPAMAHHDSPLLQRIDRLIEGAPVDIRFSRPRAMLASVLALSAAAVLLPGFALDRAQARDAVAAIPVPPTPPAPPATPAPPAVSHVHVSSNTSLFGNDTTVVQISDKGHVFSAKIDGRATFGDHDELASLVDGGSASFSEKVAGGDTRRVDFRSTGGALVRRYFLNDSERPVDAAAQAWMDRIVGVVVRETAIDAAARVARLKARGGADAVLDEIGRIQSGYARGVYIGELAKSGSLGPAQVTRAIGFAGGIDSDYERRNALGAIAASRPLDAAQQKLVLAQARRIDSDYERAELLVGMLPTLAPAADVRAAWLQEASALGSDYEHRRVLAALLAQAPADDATLAQIIAAAKTIGSDYERRELLVDAIHRIGDADRVSAAYAAAAGDIGSDYERREALLALIAAPKFGAAGSHAVLAAAAGIGSDYECSEVLVALARVMPNDAGLIEDYRRVARRLGDNERGAAERALDRFSS